VKDAPLRGGHFNSQGISRLPLAAREPIALARTLPGVVPPSGSRTFGIGGEATQFSINGQRPRGNNYLLDGTDNNDIFFTGLGQSFNISDAVQEVSVQTSNFGVEFGRAGGGVFNVITKSGTNEYHGTALWQYASQRFNSVSNTDKLNGIPQSVFSHNLYGLTLGGPVRKNRTFLFGAWQQDTFRSTRQFKFVLPTAEAVRKLRALFPSNPRLDLYLDGVGDLRGSANAFPLALGVDPVTSRERGSVTFGSADVGLPLQEEGPQWLVRLDHNASEAHRLSFRYLYDSKVQSPGVDREDSFTFPGYIADQNRRNQNFLFSDTYMIRSTWTNEFRFSYGRIGVNWPISPRSIPLAQTVPLITIRNIAAPGISTAFPQFRFVNNWLFQETQSKLAGRHNLRYGFEFLRQLAKQRGPFVERGALTYTDSSDFSALANYLDDFSGPAGELRRNFGSPVVYPNSFRQSYFLQDTWKATPSLTLTLGLRYENFGQPANALKFPAFAGFDPAQFLVPNRVQPDSNNFGPSVGLAWSPRYSSGWLGRLFGDGKTVWRSGYQISYDAMFSQLVSFAAVDSPNAVRIVVKGVATGRGTPHWFARLPTVGTPPRISDAQQNILDKNLRSPYTERWSFGWQRELPSKILLDLSYVGSASHKLFTEEDVNPQQLNGVRLHPNFGIRQIRSNAGNSAYHALQLRVDRRFAQGFEISGSYTWSKSMDSTSEVFTNDYLTSVPSNEGGLKLDRGLSDYHRGQRLTILYLWGLPGPKSGVWKQVFAGWSVTGITTFQSGAPFTVLNGFDRNNDGILNDRPDIGNSNAPLNSRAILASGCATGYRNPDTNLCVTPADVHFFQTGLSVPGAATVGRNTLFAGGMNNWDMSLFKILVITESKKLEFRWEAFNVFNHPQFVNVPERNVVSSPAGRFLNPDFTDSGIRTMRLQLKLIF